MESLSDNDKLDLPEYDMDPYKIDDPWPMNPIDFYDNDDGFWDEFII